MSEKVVATNRKAFHDYFILERFEAGIVLTGSEIKSIRAGQISLKGAFVQISGSDAWLIDAHISPYNPATRQNHDPTRRRKLLLHKREIRELASSIQQKGLTVIPLRVYLKDGLAKVEIGLAKGTRNYDKRQRMADKDAAREIDQTIKQRSRRAEE